MHDLCVIIVSHDGKRWLEPALDTLLEHAGELQLDVVVVDNGSDGAAEHVEGRFPQVRTLHCENRGFGHANNRGLETSNARYVLFLNPDTEVLEGELSALVSVLDTRPDLGLVGVRQLRPDGSLAPTIRRFPRAAHTVAEALGVERVPLMRRLLGERELDQRVYERETPCDWTSGSFMLVRNEALESVGPFDERFFLFSEETDLCKRLRGAGWQIAHLPEVTIRHYESDGWENAALESQQVFARMQFAQKHFSRVGQASYRAALAVRYVLRLGLYSTVRRRHAGRRRAVREALRVVVRNQSPFAS